MQRSATAGFVQHAVWRNGGLGSSEVLFNFASMWLVQAAVETRHCSQAAASLCVMREQHSGHYENKIERFYKIAGIGRKIKYFFIFLLLFQKQVVPLWSENC